METLTVVKKNLNSESSQNEVVFLLHGHQEKKSWVQSNVYSQQQWYVDLPVAPPVPEQQLGRLLSTPNTDPRGSPLFPHVVSKQLMLQRQRELFIVTSVAAKRADFSCVKHTIHYEAVHIPDLSNEICYNC